MKTKICPRKSCIHQQEEQSVDNFTKAKHTKDHLCKVCKDCKHDEYIRDQQKTINRVQQRYYSNLEKGIKPKPSPNKPQNDRKYYEKNKEKIIAYTTAWTTKNRRENIEARLASNLRRRLNHLIRGDFKAGSAVADLGIINGGIKDLKVWLEEQFYSHPITGEAMTWENYGKAWHVDHIIPLSTVNLRDRKQFLKVSNWFNLRPLWAEENIARSNRI